MNISVNNKQWTRVQLSAGFSCLTPQTQGGFYYSRTDLGTDVSNLGKRLDVVSFSRPLGVNLTAPIDIWVLSTEDEGLLSYENEIVSGAKVIFVNTGGGTGTGGNYTFNNPLSETGGNVNLNFDTNGLKLQNGRLALDLTTDPNFTFVQNEIADINQDINALEAQDTIFTNSIASINTKIGTATLQTTAKDLSGAVNELKTGITQNTQSISTLDGQAVKLTGNQTIAGNKVFTSKLEIDANDEVLKLKNTSNTSNYIAGYEGNTRIYYIGKDGYNSTDLSIKNEYSVNGWITLKTKSKFDQAYTITDNAQIVHKKYVDDTINTNCVKLTRNQEIAGDKTFSGFSKFINFVDMNLAPSTTYPFMLRFIGDKWPDGQSADLIRFHKFGPTCGYKVYLNGNVFGYAEIYGLTLISNMKDPTENAHGANKRYVDNAINNNALPKATTNAINTIQVNNSGSKYFNFDYVLDGTGYRNWSGIQLRAKRNPNDFETMWKVEYRDQNNLGLFMTCIGNKLNFDSDTKIVGVSCEDSDGEKTATSKKYVDDKINTEISQIKSKIKEIVAQSTDFNDFKSRIQNW